MYPASLLKLIVNCMYSVLFAVGTTANITVMVVLLARLRLKSVSNIFILNLALADFLYLVWIPLVIAKIVLKTWPLGIAMCKLYYFCTGINQYGSVMFLTLLCVDRYLAVCWPVWSRGVRTPRYAFGSVVICWLLMVGLMSPLLLYSSLEVESVEDYVGGVKVWRNTSQCAIYWIPLDQSIYDNTTSEQDLIDEMHRSRKIFTLYTFLVGFFLPLCVMWTLYSLILRKLVTRQRTFTTRSRQRQRSTRKVTRTVLAILVLYTLCFTPSWCFNLIVEFAYHLVAQHGYWFSIAGYLAFSLSYFSSALNPVLYTFLNVACRNALYELCCKRAAASYRHREFSQTDIGTIVVERVPNTTTNNCRHTSVFVDHNLEETLL